MSLASVVIDNYNYARFLPEAIDSALRQTWPDTEVVVVDDGSTDDSRRIMAGYGDRIVPVLKPNGGQNSALNAGFARSRGSVVLFLDADDALLPTAAAAAMAALAEPDVVKVHWPWLEWDESSRETGRLWWKPLPEPLPGEELRDLVLREGPDALSGHLPGGNAYRREFLESVFPLPDVRSGWLSRPAPDWYLAILAALHGRIAQSTRPQACYRMHRANGYQALPFEDRLAFDRALFDYVSQAAGDCCDQLGIGLDGESCREPFGERRRERWQAASWAYRVERAAAEIVALVPQDASFILADGDGWKTDPLLAGRRRIPFLERDGQYWGNPADDATAIGELERLRGCGAAFIAIAWPVFWWFDYYPGFGRYLRAEFPCALENDRLVVFDLRNGSAVL
jgi:glycosyltransferase involved in cell wall biosynthesis